MELFATGDQSQLQVIRRWIEECDAFVLLLGGRYGSVEPASGKSHTQLEYSSGSGAILATSSSRFSRRWPTTSGRMG
jgi:hypothetical protein